MGEHTQARKCGFKFRLKPFTRDKRGIAAVEMALVSTPFFWLMMGLAEIGMIFVVQTNIDYAMMEMERQIRTGQAQEQGVSASTLRTRVCDRMNDILNITCTNKLFVDVRSYPNFDAMNAPNPGADGNLNDGEMDFDPGAPGEVVLVRAYYTWNLLTPVISMALANFDSHTRLLTSASLFRNEPYSTDVSS